MDIKVDIICSIVHDIPAQHVGFAADGMVATSAEIRAMYGADRARGERNASDVRLLFLPRWDLGRDDPAVLDAFIRRHWRAFKSYHHAAVRIRQCDLAIANLSLRRCVPRSLPRIGRWTFDCLVEDYRPLEGIVKELVLPINARQGMRDCVAFVVRGSLRSMAGIAVPEQELRQQWLPQLDNVRFMVTIDGGQYDWR